MLEPLRSGSLSWRRAAPRTVWRQSHHALGPSLSPAGHSPHSHLPVTQPPDLSRAQLGALPRGWMASLGGWNQQPLLPTLFPARAHWGRLVLGDLRGPCFQQAPRPPLRTQRCREQVSCTLEAQTSHLVLLGLRSWQGGQGGLESRGQPRCWGWTGHAEAWVQLLAGLESGGRGDLQAWSVVCGFEAGGEAEAGEGALF